MIQFTIPGATQAQERPKFSRAGKGVKAVDPPKSRAYKEVVKLVAWQNKPQQLILEPIQLEVDVYSCHQKSTTQSQNRRLLHQEN